MTLSRTARHAVAALGVASTFLSGLAFAGPTNVPFKASLVTQEVLGYPSAACPIITGTTTGTGHASHLGAVTVIGGDCIFPTTTGTYSFSNGKLTVTAANGDELRAEYNGMLNPTATAPIYAISGTYRIVGGTGRFTTATGSGTLSGLENLATTQGQFELTGTISY